MEFGSSAPADANVQRSTSLFSLGLVRSTDQEKKKADTAEILYMKDAVLFDLDGNLVTVLERRPLELNQDPDQPLTISIDGSGDVYFDYLATPKEMMSDSKLVDLILPGDRRISLDLPRRLHATFRGQGIFSEKINRRGDLHARVLLVLDNSMTFLFSHVLRDHHGIICSRF